MYSSQDLAVLVAVADTGSLRNAASALGRTQPAITQAVQRLEEAVGFALLDRSSYRAKFTERGEIFVQRARLAVSHVTALQATAMLLSRGVEPRLRIAVQGPTPPNAWIDLVKEVPHRFPNTVIEVEAGEGDLASRRLFDGDADFALLLQTYPDRYGTSVESKTLGRVEFVNVVRTDKLTQAQEGSPSVPQIIATNFDDGVLSYGAAVGHCCWRVSTHRMKAAAIEAGIGWGSVPKRMIERQLQDGTLSQLPHLGPRGRGSRAYSLYKKRDRPLGPVASFIWDLARDAGSDVRDMLEGADE